MGNKLSLYEIYIIHAVFWEIIPPPDSDENGIRHGLGLFSILLHIAQWGFNTMLGHVCLSSNKFRLFVFPGGKHSTGSGGKCVYRRICHSNYEGPSVISILISKIKYACILKWINSANDKHREDKQTRQHNCHEQTRITIPSCSKRTQECSVQQVPQ